MEVSYWMLWSSIDVSCPLRRGGEKIVGETVADCLI